jgi:hypothetical protein
VKVFISWSGERSKHIAEALRDWLPLVLHQVIPWVSSADIQAGERWGTSVANQLNETSFGIVCLTTDNLTAPWVLFEAGALAKTLNESTRVVPYLLELEPADIPPGPLAQFQAKTATYDGTLELVRSINSASAGESVPDDRIQKLFPVLWPKFADAKKTAPKVRPLTPPARKSEEMIPDILDTVRDIARVLREITTREADAGVGEKSIGQVPEWRQVVTLPDNSRRAAARTISAALNESHALRSRGVSRITVRPMGTQSMGVEFDTPFGMKSTRYDFTGDNWYLEDLRTLVDGFTIKIVEEFAKLSVTESQQAKDSSQRSIPKK